MQNREDIILSINLNDAPATFKAELRRLGDFRLPDALYEISDKALVDLWWWVKRNIQNWSTILNKPLNDMPGSFCQIDYVRDLVDLGNPLAISLALEKYQFTNKKGTLLAIYSTIKTYPSITLIGIHRNIKGFSAMFIKRDMADGGDDITQFVISPLWYCLTHKIIFSPLSRLMPVKIVDEEERIRGIRGV